MKRAGLLILLVCLGATSVRPRAEEPKATPSAESQAAWTSDLTPIGEKDWNYARAAHLLERAGFGGTPEDIDKLAKMTPAAAVDYLVDYEKIDDSKLPAFEPSGIYPNGHKLVPIQDVVVKAIITGKAYGIKATQKGELEYQPAVNEFYTLLISEHAEMGRAGQWWAQRMLVTPRPLEEKLTLFWHDHFATSQEKVLNYELMLAQNQTLRKHANGNFRALLIAIAQDPAMLIWLDNRQNVKGKPNENFAREVMELFTMGEGQGYTEADIRELARAFTGWTMNPIETTKNEAKFLDKPSLHDDGEKTILKEKGNVNGTEAIDIILKQSAVPRFLTRKLYRNFVRTDLSPELNDKLAKVLADAKYDLKPLLKTIFLSRDFYSEASVGTQIKAPVPYVISTYRKLGLLTLPSVPDFNELTGQLGQVLFYPPNVAGWPAGRSWINPATLLTRGNFAHTLLFTDPVDYGHPEKVVAEGYRNIPQMFPKYNIKPHVWNAKEGKMEPVSVEKYEKFLVNLNAAELKAMGSKEGPMVNEMPAGPVKDVKSKLGKIADDERFNLAVGVYSGFVEAYNRVKPIPRTSADVDFAAMLKEAKVGNAEDAVDYFSKRFLRVELQAERRAAVVKFLAGELKSDKLDYSDKKLGEALRKIVHLILSAPEYQLG